MKIGDRVKIIDNCNETYIVLIEGINYNNHGIVIFGKKDKSSTIDYIYFEDIKSIELCQIMISDLKLGQKFKCESFYNKKMVYTKIGRTFGSNAKFNFIDSNYLYSYCDEDYLVEVVE